MTHIMGSWGLYEVFSPLTYVRCAGYSGTVVQIAGTSGILLLLGVYSKSTESLNASSV